MAVRNIDGGYTLTKAEARLVHEFISKASWWGDTKLEKLRGTLPNYTASAGAIDLTLHNDRFNVTDRKPEPMPQWERDLLSSVQVQGGGGLTVKNCCMAAPKVGDSIWKSADFMGLPVGTHLDGGVGQDEVVLTKGKLILNLNSGSVYSMDSLYAARKIVSFGDLEKVTDYTKEPIGTKVFYDDTTLTAKTSTWEKVAHNEWRSTTGMVHTNTGMGGAARVLRFRPPVPKVRVLKAGDAVLTQAEADSLPIGASVWFDGGESRHNYWVRESATRWKDGIKSTMNDIYLSHSQIVRPEVKSPRIVRSITPDVVPDPKNPKVGDTFDTTEEYEALPVGTELSALWVKNHNNKWGSRSQWYNDDLSSFDLVKGRKVTAINVVVPPAPVKPSEFKVGDKVYPSQFKALPVGAVLTYAQASPGEQGVWTKLANGKFEGTSGMVSELKDESDRYWRLITFLPRSRFRVGQTVWSEDFHKLPTGTVLTYAQDTLSSGFGAWRKEPDGTFSSVGGGNQHTKLIGDGQPSHPRTIWALPLSFDK